MSRTSKRGVLSLCLLASMSLACGLPHLVVTPYKAPFRLDPTWNEHGEALVLACYQHRSTLDIDYGGPSLRAVKKLTPDADGWYHVPGHPTWGFTGVYLWVPFTAYQLAPVIAVATPDGVIGFDSVPLHGDGGGKVVGDEYTPLIRKDGMLLYPGAPLMDGDLPRGFVDDVRRMCGEMIAPRRAEAR